MDRPKSRLFGSRLLKKGEGKKEARDKETTEADSVGKVTGDPTRSLWSNPFQIRLLTPCRSWPRYIQFHFTSPKPSLSMRTHKDAGRRHRCPWCHGRCS